MNYAASPSAKQSLSPKLGDGQKVDVPSAIVSADGQDHIFMRVLASHTGATLPDLCVLIPGIYIYVYVHTCVYIHIRVCIHICIYM